MAAGGVLQAIKASLSEDCGESAFKKFIALCGGSGEKNQRISLLKECFGIKVSTDVHHYPGEYDGGEIVLDLVEQAASHAVNRGLPCHELYFFLSFYVFCLDLIAGNGEDDEAPSLVKVIQQLQNNISTHSKHLSESSFCMSMDFVTKSLFQHFHLYQFLLTQPQTTDLTSVELTVETPAEPLFSLRLQDAIAEETWLKAKKKQEMEAEYDRISKELDAADEEARSHADTNLKEVYQTQLADFTDGPKKVSKEQLSTIIESLLKAHAESSSLAVSQSLLRQSAKLDFRLSQLESLPQAQAQQESSGPASTPSLENDNSGKT